MEVVVGLDSGTTATKAVTAGVDGRVRDLVSVGYPLLVPAPGRAELDARRLQQAAVEALGVPAAEVITKDHAVIRWQFPPLLAVLLDSPEHLHR